MRKILVALLALTVATGTVGLFAAPKATDGGKVLTIYVWNDEFQTRFKDYFEKAGLVPKDVTVNWVVTPNQDNAYQNKLDEALLNQDKASPNDKIDIFLVEADYALKYVNTDASLDVIKDVGLTKADLSQQFQYTKDLLTDKNGALKGVSWQGCPAGFIYRRSIAKEVLGTDDPAKVQAQIDTWDKFDAVAAKLKAKNYFAVSGYDDDFRVFTDNAKLPWVDKNGKIQIDPNINKWIDQTKTYTDKGYNNKASLWSAESSAGAGPSGKVFGYFGPGWFIDFCLAGWSKADPKGPDAAGNGTYGDWAFTKGPQGFSWGGTWLVAAAGTDNISLVKSVFKKLTVDQDTLTAIAKDKGDFTNNIAVINKLAKDPKFGNKFLGGQNYYGLLVDSAKAISRKNITSYDQGFTEELQKAFKDYFDGKVTKDQAWNNFYTAILEKYPNLKK
jgi:hypothetical protein